jgi:hypothetical protein
MNEQVQRYFQIQKLLRLRDKMYEGTLYLHTDSRSLRLIDEMALGTGVNIPITEEDLDFVYTVRRMYKKQGNPEGSLPPPARVLQAKYALLHPAPLHDYYKKWVTDRLAETLHILDRKRVGGYQIKPEYAATVNDDMRKQYATATKDKQPQASRENDEKVADWWINENRNAIQEFKKNRNPIPQIKIIRRGTDSVTLGFKGLGKGYSWYAVDNVPIDMNKFRDEVSRHGFDEKRHSAAILSQSLRKWQNMIDPEKIKDAQKQLVKNPKLAGVEPDKETGVHKTGLGKEPWMSPGYKHAEINPSEEYAERYSEDADFRSHIEKIVMRAVAKVTYASIKEDETGNLNHKISLPWWQSGIDEARVKEALDYVRMWLLQLSNSAKFDWKSLTAEDLNNADHPANHWLRIKASSGAMSAKGKILFPRGLAQGMGEPGQGKGDGRRDGRDQSGGASQGSDHTLAATHDGLDATNVLKWRKGNFLDDRVGDEEGRQMTADELLTHIRQHPASITKDQWIRKLIARYAEQGDEKFRSLAMSLGLIKDQDPEPQVEPEDDEKFGNMWIKGTQPGSGEEDDDEEIGTMDKYAAKTHAEGRYSFHSYLQKRMNEMEVVWGNDKKSAKKIKPGETLKGGIQVQGAPWSAGGGPNKKGNDVKIKG